MGTGTLSLLTSQAALNKATATDVRRFAQFESAEQTAVGAILKEMGTVPPPMDAQDRAVLDRIRSLPRGAAFDRAYAMQQFNAHVYLRSLCDNYLRNSAPRRNRPMEMHVRHLAMFALSAIAEHISFSQRLMNGQDLQIVVLFSKGQAHVGLSFLFVDTGTRCF